MKNKNAMSSLPYSTFSTCMIVLYEFVNWWVLFSVYGPSTYKLIKNLVTPRSPSDLSFDSVVDLVKEHYSPKPSVIVQRFKFNSRLQQPGETVTTFVAELRRLSEFCEYGEMLDDILCDHLVCSI